jgi:methionyl-tRNA formyltransferase
MYMVDKLDAGDVISKIKTPIGPDEDAQALTARLAELGAEALSEAIAAIESGTAVRTAQDEEASTYAPMLSRDLSPIDWTKSAHAVNCQIRGLIPWPAASAVVDGRAMKVFKSQETGEETSAEPGTLLSADKRGIAVACGDGKALHLTEIQADGGKRMPVADYLRGHPIQL